jgi:hypothetical protein
MLQKELSYKEFMENYMEGLKNNETDGPKV